MVTFKNCKEVKHIMIMITDYDFLSYVIFDQQLKITFRKSSGSPEKIHSPPKNAKSASPPLFANIENFAGPPGGGLCYFPFLEFKDLYIVRKNTILKPFMECTRLKMNLKWSEINSTIP